MGLTKRKDGWYVEFPVLDDGKVLALARGTPGARIKRWKTGSSNKTVAKEQEAMIKTDLMKKLVQSEQAQGPVAFKALAEMYLASPDVKRQASYPVKVSTVQKRFIPAFGDMLVQAIRPTLIEKYRELRRQEVGYHGKLVTPATLNSV